MYTKNTKLHIPTFQQRLGKRVKWIRKAHILYKSVAPYNFLQSPNYLLRENACGAPRVIYKIKPCDVIHPITTLNSY